MFGFISNYFKRRECRRLGIPFRKKEWYNYRINALPEMADEYGHICVFDQEGNYIRPPKKGDTVVYRKHGLFYLYRIVGFDNGNPCSDWRHHWDWVDPVIEYIRPALPGDSEMKNIKIEIFKNEK